MIGHMAIYPGYHMRRLLLGIACFIVLPSLHAGGQSIVLSPAQRQALNLHTGRLEKAASIPLDGLPATVRAPLEGSAVVTAPFAGVVTAVLVREGQPVTRHQPLARIQSREALTLAAELTAAGGSYRVAAAQAARDRQLLAEGIIPQARTQAAEAQREATSARLHELQAARAMAPVAAGAAPGTYELRAPLAGRVIERSLRLGEPVGMLAKAYVIARQDQALLELHVPARYAPELRVGQPVRTAAGIEGKLSEIGGVVDPASQTVLVRALLDTRQLLPGQQTSATLQLPAPADALRVPADALVEREGGYVLFVVDARGYTPVPVTLLTQLADGRSVVHGKLRPGTEVVTTGAGALKSLPAGAQ